jgi:hypothetical protein
MRAASNLGCFNIRILGVTAVRAEIDARLGPIASWQKPPDGYPNGLALCVIDSIWSLGIRYQTQVVPVIVRYRRFRDGRADTDGLAELLAVFAELGGDQAFADRIGTQHKTSSHARAPLKATAVRLAAQGLSALSIDTMASFHQAMATQPKQVKQAWRSVPGQRSSAVGWRYLLMLAGVDEVKADRMVRRFVSRALGSDVPSETAWALALQAAESLCVPARTLDYAIWSYESGRVAIRPSGPTS